MNTTRHLLARAIACGLAAALIVSFGCSKKEEQAPPPVKGADQEVPSALPLAPPGKSTLKGKVTVGDKPVVAGRVVLFHTKGLCLTVGVINADGTYEVRDLPAGEVQVGLILNPSGDMPFPTTAMTGAPTGPPGGPPGMPGGKGPPGGPPGLPAAPVLRACPARPAVCPASPAAGRCCRGCRRSSWN